MKKECPCKNCTDRKANCHNTCSKEYTYTEWKNDRDKELAEINRKKELYSLCFFHPVKSKKKR